MQPAMNMQAFISYSFVRSRIAWLCGVTHATPYTEQLCSRGKIVFSKAHCPERLYSHLSLPLVLLAALCFVQLPKLCQDLAVGCVSVWKTAHCLVTCCLDAAGQPVGVTPPC